MGFIMFNVGDGKLRRKDRKEFISRARTVLEQGGMMLTYLDDHTETQFPLLEPLGLCADGTKRLLFNYNYLERDVQDMAWLDLKTGEMNGIRHGDGFYCGVMHAVDVLREFYTTNPMLATEFCGLHSDALTIGWLNHLFDESWSNRRFLTLLKLIVLAPDWEDLIPSEQNRLLRKTVSLEIDPLKELLSLLQGQEKNLLRQLAVVDNPASVLSILNMLHCLKDGLKHYKADGGTPLSLTNLLLQDDWSSAGKSEEQAETERTIRFNSRMLPRKTVFALYRECFGLADGSPESDQLLTALNGVPDDFSFLSDEGEFGLSPEGLSFYSSHLRKAIEEPVTKYTTSRFLGGSWNFFRNRFPYPKWNREVRGDFMIPWWTPDGDISLSDSLLGWMRELRGRLDALKEESLSVSAKDTIQNLANLQLQAWIKFHTPFLFRSTWEEFSACAMQPVYRAAVLLMEQVYQECLDDPNKEDGKEQTVPLYQYCALLANRELRKEQLGF